MYQGIQKPRVYMWHQNDFLIGTESTLVILEFEMDIPIKQEDIAKEWFQKVLDQAEENVIVDSLSIEYGSKPGDNMGSEALRVVAKGEKNGEPWQDSYILKLMPVKEFIRNLVVGMKMFQHEAEAYNKILPDMIKIQEEDTKVYPTMCRCVYADVNSNNDGIIVLEDLKPRGYTMADIRKGLDLDHCKLVMDGFARLHALGYKLKYSSELPLPEQYQTLKSFFFEYMKQVYQNVDNRPCHLPCKILKKTPGKEHLLKVLEEHAQSLLDKSFVAEVSEPLSTICHGDGHSNNMLFKHDKDGKPVSVVFVDLQVMYYGLPTRDLSYFFCISTTGEVRKKHMKELLQYYHNQLFHYLDILKVKEITTDNFSFDLLWKMYYRETIHIGLFRGLEGIPHLMLEEKDKVAPRDMEGKNMEEMMKLRQEELEDVMVNNKEASVRVCDLMEEVIKEGTFQM